MRCEMCEGPLEEGRDFACVQCTYEAMVGVFWMMKSLRDGRRIPQEIEQRIHHIYRRLEEVELPEQGEE